MRTCSYPKTVIDRTFVGRGLDPADHVTKYSSLDEWNNVMFFCKFPVDIS